MTDSLALQDLSAFDTAGRMLLACRCNNSHSGNLSIRHGHRIVITRTGAMLASLTADDLVTTSFEPTEQERRRASSEIAVHLKIYQRTEHLAIAHGHALAAVAVGWLTDWINPIDVEGAYYHGGIPVLEYNPATASVVLGEALGAVLAQESVVVLRGHGVFAGGATLEQAFQRVTSVNDSADLIIKARQLGLDPRQLANAPYLEVGWIRD
ncbi:MAG: class II aldolase/adducin family protein [Phycisphaerae bacterium]